MPDPIRSLQQLIITNFGLSPSGYTGSRGDTGYVGSAGAGGAGPRITSLTYANGAVAANPAGGETVTVTGSGFNTGANVYLDTLLCTTSYVSSTSLTFTTPAKSVASYMLYVYNTDGSFGVYPVGIIYSSMPVWATASGALTGAGINTSYSQTVSATGDGSIAYSVTSGSLPNGLSLNSGTGAITGTAPGTAGTSTFTITATDSQNQTASRSFSIVISSAVSTVEYLVVAGGGGGGGVGNYNNGAGGGAGGYRTASGFAVASGTPITVTVGAGGGGGPGQTGSTPAADGSKGNDSVFSSITSTGGGYGTGNNAVQTPGGPGGSGGGGGWYDGAGGAGNTPATSPSQGNNGGAAVGSSGGPNYGTGGGGGAGAVGGTGTGLFGGTGGIGLASSITGTSTYYAGGGGGGGGASGGDAAGGLGGGGASTRGNGTAGTANTGGGGGGAGAAANLSGGNGGSGIVIIRYADSYPAAIATTGSPTITNPTGYRVYKWTTSGSITF